MQRQRQAVQHRRRDERRINLQAAADGVTASFTDLELGATSATVANPAGATPEWAMENVAQQALTARCGTWSTTSRSVSFTLQNP
jgi:hypothetical protein